MKISTLLIITLISINKLIAQGKDDILKLRAFSVNVVSTGEPFDSKNDEKCNILIVVSIKNSMLNKITIYSKTEQDYDIVYKVSENTTYSGEIKFDNYHYIAIDNSGIKVPINITVCNLSNEKPIWIFEIIDPTLHITYSADY